MPHQRAPSGRLGFGAAPTGGRRWHHLSGEGASGWDHNQFPLTGADREGPRISLLKNAQHVGHLLAVTRSWSPADHDPPADIGGGGPDFHSAAQDPPQQATSRAPPSPNQGTVYRPRATRPNP